MSADCTPLELELLRMIAADGPMPVDRYMALCLGHPLHGYYMTRDPLGEWGDFTTAPEVTQMFGEIVGVWCVQCFELMGRPIAFDLIELGPGRGTLMSDLLRAARALPDFISRVSVRLVETSPVFRDLQRRALSAATVPVTWHEDIEQIPPAPTLIVANEFFDALPVRQFQRLQEGWGERAVGVRDEKLALGLIPAALELPSWTSGAKEGEVAEISPTASHWGASIGRRLGGRPGAALIIDYGHVRSALGETLQAVRAHAPVPVLDRPGESDLTAHVDFQALGEAIRQSGGIVWPAMTQRDFLVGMGLDLRASMLARTATDAQKRDLLAAVERVAGPRQMGHLFKVQAATCPGLACPHPFAG